MGRKRIRPDCDGAFRAVKPQPYKLKGGGTMTKYAPENQRNGFLCAFSYTDEEGFLTCQTCKRRGLCKNNGHRGVEGNATEGTLPRVHGEVPSEVTGEGREYATVVSGPTERDMEDSEPDWAGPKIPEVFESGADHNAGQREENETGRQPTRKREHPPGTISSQSVPEVLREPGVGPSPGIRGREKATRDIHQPPMAILGGYHSSEGRSEGIGRSLDTDGHPDRPGCLPSGVGDGETPSVRHPRDYHQDTTWQGPKGQRGIDHPTHPVGPGELHLRPESKDAEGAINPVPVRVHGQQKDPKPLQTEFHRPPDPQDRPKVRTTDRGEPPRSTTKRSPTDLHLEPNGQNGSRSPIGIGAPFDGTDPRVHRDGCSRPTGDISNPRPVSRKTVPRGVQPGVVVPQHEVSGDVYLAETRKVQDWYSELPRKHEAPQTGDPSSREREAGDRFLELLEPDHVRDHLLEVFKY